MARGPVRLNQYDQRTRPQSTDQPFVRPVDNGAGQLAEGIARIGQALRNEAQVQIAREEDDGRVYASSAMARARAGASEITRRAFTEAQDGWRGATQRISSEWGALREEALSAAPTPAAQRFLLQAFDAYQPELLERAAGAEQEARMTWRSDELDASRIVESNAIAIDPTLYEQALAQRTELIEGQSEMPDALRRRHLAADRATFATTAVAALVERDPVEALRSLRGGMAPGTPDAIASVLGGSVTSAERTPEHNAEVGGAPNSMHVSNEAVDLTVPERYRGMDRAAIEADVRRRLDAAGIGASEIIYEGDHIHVGWRGVENNAQRPALRNVDGSISTEETITIEADGRFYNIPTIVNGRRVGEERATQLWEQGQNPEVGSFDSMDAAEQAARARSEQIGIERASTAGPYGALTGAQRLQFINQAEAAIDRRQREAATDVQQRARSALALIEAGEQPSANAPSVEEVRAVAGEADAAAYQTAMETYRIGSEMGRMTNAELIDIAASAALDTGTEQERYQNAMRRSAAQNILRLRAEDPVAYQLRQGLLQRSDLIQAFNDGDMGLVNGILQNRASGVMENARTLGIDAGRYRPLTEGEASIIGAQVRQMTAQQRGAFMRNAAAWMGRESPAYSSMMAQLFPDSPATAYAGYLTGIGEQEAADADLILRGVDILGAGAEGAAGRSRLVDMPQDDDLLRAWREFVGDAYAPLDERSQGLRQAESQSFETFRAAYAGLIERSPQQGNRVNRQLARRAASIASGGVVVWAGRDTLTPPGMSPQRFDSAVREGMSRYQQFQGQNPRDYTLLPLGVTERGYRYGVYDGDDPVRTTGSGRPVEIEVRRR